MNLMKKVRLLFNRRKVRIYDYREYSKIMKFPPYRSDREYPELEGTIDLSGTLDTGAPCSTCEAPQRRVWVSGSNPPKFETLEIGNWIKLDQCPVCQRLWVTSTYEPWSAFTYSVRWHLSRDDWHKLHERDNGTTLSHWMMAVLKALHGLLSPEDKTLVEEHRERGYYRHNPYDQPVENVPDLMALLKQKERIDQT